MAGRIEKARSYDENATKRRQIELVENGDTASDSIARNTLAVPDSISPFSTTVFASVVELSFESAEKVTVDNVPLSPSSNSDLTVYFVQTDSTIVGPYVLSAYAFKTISVRQGFTGVQLVSDAQGTYATVEALHV